MNDTPTLSFFNSFKMVRFCLNLIYAQIDINLLSSVCLAASVLQLQEVGDFGDENCLPPLNLIRSTKLHLTTEPPISCRCCYLLAFSSVIIISFVKPSFAILILVKCFSDFCSVGNQFLFVFTTINSPLSSPIVAKLSLLEPFEK